MLKIYGKFIFRSLELIFKDCLANAIFPSDWGKGNILPFHKTSDKQCLNKYHSVSLLPLCGKIPKRLLFKEMFSFFTENYLISQHQSGFNSCTNQLSITHKIYKSLDEGLDIRSVFLDISKAFDKA